MNRYTLFQVRPGFIREYGFASLREARKAAGRDDLPKAARIQWSMEGGENGKINLQD